MSDGIDIPVNVDASRAVIALEQVVASLSGVQRSVLNAVQATESGRPHVEALAAAFLGGETSAHQLRASLVALTGEVPKTAAELRRAAEQARQAETAIGALSTSLASARDTWRRTVEPLQGIASAFG